MKTSINSETQKRWKDKCTKLMDNVHSRMHQITSRKFDVFQGMADILTNQIYRGNAHNLANKIFLKQILPTD